MKKQKTISLQTLVFLLFLALLAITAFNVWNQLPWYEENNRHIVSPPTPEELREAEKSSPG